MSTFKRTYFGHTTEETKQVLMSVFLMSLIFFLWQWTTTDLQSISDGVILFVFVFLIVGISMFVHELFHWYWARKKGYTHHYEFNNTGNLFGLFFTFFMLPFIPLLFIAPGGTRISRIEHLALGKFRHGFNQADMAFVAFAGPLANFLIAFLLSFFYEKGANPFLHLVIFVNLMIALFSMFPLPKSDGLNVFAKSRMLWFFLFAMILVYSIFILLVGWASIWLTLVIAVLLLWGFWYFFDK